MVLSWLLHSASTHVFGYPKDTTMRCNHVMGSTNEGHVQGGAVFKRLKFPNEGNTCMDMSPAGFQMPLHYPRYTKADYENMEEWKLDMLLREYGLNFKGTLDEKRSYAMGAFLWPDQV
ncbi:hypothetical protein L1049_009799 [Liquidambar formosana]|uniref:DUF7722 domain-containing protein n=1 Tax=Liquidambar formosana TaxID=63359 RepID=A0AAP0R3T8_LIQFO